MRQIVVRTDEVRSLTLRYKFQTKKVTLVCLRITRFGRIVQRIGVLRGFDELAPVTFQATAATIAEEAIVSYELHIMLLMTLLNTIHTDRISGGRIAGVAAIEIGHRKRKTAGYFVQTLAGAQRFLDEILVIENFVVRQNDGLHVVGKALESIRENTVTVQGSLCVRDLNTSTSVRMNSVVLQHGIRLRRDQYATLRISENVVVDQFGLARVENADATVLRVENFVFYQFRV